MEINVNFLFSLFFIIKNTKVPNRKFWTFFFPLIEYWNITSIFTLILSTIKRKMKLSGNVAFPTMLQSVASLKIENWKLQSIFNFFFIGENIQNRWQKIPKREGEGSIRAVVFAPSALSPGRSASFHALEEFICPCHFPSHATLL